MRILFLTPQLPFPPHQGTTIRNFHLICRLAAHHTIDLVTFLAPGQTLESAGPLAELCARIIAIPQPERSLWQRLASTIFQRQPDMALRLESVALYAKLRHLLTKQVRTHSPQAEEPRPYDVVQVEGIEMAQYGRFAVKTLAAAHPTGQRPLLIFDDHNCEYLLQKRNALTDLRNPRRLLPALYSVVQWAKLRTYEAAICRAADAVLAVSEPDRAALQSLVPTASTTVVPNGIDPAAAAPQLTHALTIDANNPARLVFTGKMDYRPNVDAALWFAHSVLPLIQAQQPHVCFQIVGMNPHPRLDPLRDNPAIELTGAVADVTPYMEGAAVYVVPLRIGGGTRFKVLEAMNQALPLVSTTLGVEGIGVTADRELLVGDSADAFAAAVLTVLTDRAATGTLAATLGSNARAFAAAHYSWSQIVPKVEAVYRQTRAAL